MSDYYFWRLSLFYETDSASANSIIESQRIPRNSGIYGPGVYIANTIEACHQKSDRKGVFLCVDAYLGRTKLISEDEASNGINQEYFIEQGYTAICGERLPTGREFIVFDPSRIHNIKYVLGAKLQAFFKINSERITLFFTTSKAFAKSIVLKQRVPKTDGPFGHICYLYGTLKDALAVQPPKFQKTYLAADVMIVDFYKLGNYENMHSKSIPSNCQTMVGVYNGITFFMIRNRSLIKNIHFCGGKPWNT